MALCGVRWLVLGPLGWQPPHCCAPLLPPLWPSCSAEDLHHFDTASWRLLAHAVTDPGLRESVLFVVTYRCLPACRGVEGLLSSGTGM